MQFENIRGYDICSYRYRYVIRCAYKISYQIALYQRDASMIIQSFHKLAGVNDLCLRDWTVENIKGEKGDKV